MDVLPESRPMTDDERRAGRDTDGHALTAPESRNYPPTAGGCWVLNGDQASCSAAGCSTRPSFSTAPRTAASSRREPLPAPRGAVVDGYPEG
jgi:hypothetical protein